LSISFRLIAKSSDDLANLKTYNASASVDVYRNFLDWLFATFDVSEADFRKSLLSLLRLSRGTKVLITSVGLGDDLPIVRRMVGPDGEVHAQDI